MRHLRPAAPEPPEEGPLDADDTADLGAARAIMTRRAVLAGLAVAAVGVVAGVVGCVGSDDEEDADDADAQASAATDVALAHLGAVADDDATYFVRFDEGAVVRLASGSGDGEGEVLYSNGQVNQLGIRYLAVADGALWFCDVPSRSICSLPTGGGDVTVTYTAEDAAYLPVPIEVAGSTVWFSLIETAGTTGTVCSVGCDGSGFVEHLTLPAGFSAQYVDPDAGVAYYSGVGDSDEREVRSASLDGSGETTLWSFDGVASADSAMSWQVAGGRLYVEAQDNASGTNRLLSVALDGSEEEATVLHDFSTQKVLFDRCGDDLYFVDRETLAVMVASADDPDAPATLASVPKLADGTTVSALEAGSAMAWVTTATAGEDTATEYVTYQVARETGELTELA